AEGVDGYPAEKDPGVVSVTQIYHYFKKFGINTQVMGASFRNKEEIFELAGCDLLTISPTLLEEISTCEGELPIKLSREEALKSSSEKISIDEKTFRWMLNENQTATEKLPEGIRKFGADIVNPEILLAAKYL